MGMLSTPRAGRCGVVWDVGEVEPEQPSCGEVEAGVAPTGRLGAAPADARQCPSRTGHIMLLTRVAPTRSARLSKREGRSVVNEPYALRGCSAALNSSQRFKCELLLRQATRRPRTTTCLRS